MTDFVGNETVMSPNHIHASGQNDWSDTSLINAIEQGFSSFFY